MLTLTLSASGGPQNTLGDRFTPPPDDLGMMGSSSLTYSLLSNDADGLDDELTHVKKAARAEYNKNSLDIVKPVEQSSKSLEDFPLRVFSADQASLSNYQNNSVGIQQPSRYQAEDGSPNSSIVARLLQSIDNCVNDDIQRDGGNPPNIVGPEYPTTGILNQAFYSTCGL